MLPESYKTFFEKLPIGRICVNKNDKIANKKFH